jgi:hypothetical protein
MKNDSPAKQLFKLKEISPDHKVKVIIDPMALDESRKEFPYRPFKENSESVWLINEQNLPEWLLILNGKAIRCGKCYATTEIEYLKYSSKTLVCPDCDGRAEASGLDPRLSRDKYYKVLANGKFQIGLSVPFR